METFSVEEEVRELQISDSEGNVFIQAGAEPTISVSALIEGDSTRVDHGVSDQILSLRTRCGGGWLSTCAVDYDIQVPEALTVWADAGSGNVTLVGLRADAVLISGSGNIRVESYTSQSLVFDAGSGDFAGEDIAASQVEGDAGSGDVDIELVTAPDSVSLDAGSGDISVTLPADTYEVQANSEDVVIQGITNESGAARKLVLSADSGRITVTGI